MTRQAVIRRVLRLMTVHAEPHRVIHRTFRDGLLREVAVAGRAIDAGADVRRVVEANVRFSGEAVDPLPRDFDALVSITGDLLDQRLVGRDLAVADHAGLDAGNAGDRPLV